MAALFTVEKVTPHSIVYKIDINDGAAGVKAISGGPNSIYSDLVAAGFGGGPLSQTLLDAYAASNADKFNLDGAQSGRIRTRVVSGINASQTLPTAFNLHWTTTGFSSQLVGALSSLYVEIRLQHSLDR